MTTYTRVNYRKIYEANFGVIPRDELGRTYHIHHVDGDRQNNNPSNLIAVSAQEHYEIHLRQGDYGAAKQLARFLHLSQEEISELGRNANAKRVANGTHNFLGDDNPSRRMVADGTHHFFDPEVARKAAAKRIADGTHNFLQMHTCPYCGLTGKGPAMKRYHFDNCKSR